MHHLCNIDKEVNYRYTSLLATNVEALRDRKSTRHTSAFLGAKDRNNIWAIANFSGSTTWTNRIQVTTNRYLVAQNVILKKTQFTGTIITTFKTHGKLKENGLNYQEVWDVGRVQLRRGSQFWFKLFGSSKKQHSPTFFVTCRKGTMRVGEFSDICIQANIPVNLSVS